MGSRKDKQVRKIRRKDGVEQGYRVGRTAPVRPRQSMEQQRATAEQLAYPGSGAAPAQPEQAQQPEFRYLMNRTSKKVISDWRRLLEIGDLGKLTSGLYHHLIQYGGHIAHYDINGFRSHFHGNLTRLAEAAIREGQRPVPAYNDSGYTDGLNANDVNRQLAEIADELLHQVASREIAAEDAEEMRLLEGLAAKHGLKIVSDDQELPEMELVEDAADPLVVEQLVSKASALGLGDEDLDELILEQVGDARAVAYNGSDGAGQDDADWEQLADDGDTRASEINNSGLAAQVAFLVSQLGPEAAEERLQGLADEGSKQEDIPLDISGVDLSPEAAWSGDTSRQFQAAEDERAAKLAERAEPPEGTWAAEQIQGWCITEEHNNPKGIWSRLGYGQYTGQPQGAYEDGIDPASIADPLPWTTYLEGEGGAVFSGVISRSWAEGSREQVFGPLEFSQLDVSATSLKINGRPM